MFKLFFLTIQNHITTMYSVWPSARMPHNVLNMVRLAFQRSKFSVYYYVYLLLSSLFLALSAKCTIFFVGSWLCVLCHSRMQI